MLRRIRITIAWVVFILAVLLVLDFTGALHLWMGWVAKVQLPGDFGGERRGCDRRRSADVAFREDLLLDPVPSRDYAGRDLERFGTA